MIPLEFCEDFRHQQTTVPVPSHGVVYVILGLTIFVELRLMTDGQTDTQRQHIPHCIVQ